MQTLPFVALFGVVEAQLGGLMPHNVDFHGSHSLFRYLVTVNMFLNIQYISGVSD